MAVAILAFFASSLLYIQLSYRADPPPTTPRLAATPSPATGEPQVASGSELLAAVIPNPAAGPTPPSAAGAGADRERELSDCVERHVREGGLGAVKPTLPGRWPALKRAREELRLRRLALRSSCERELAP